MRKMNLKKTILVAGMTALLFSALCGCGEKKEETTAATTAAQTEAATAAQTEAATEAQTEAVTEAQTEAATAAQTEAVTEAAAVDYSGFYVETIAGRCQLNVEQKGDGSYTVAVHWSGSAYEGGEWYFSGTFDENGKMVYSDGEKIHYIFDENETETRTTEYKDGTGYIQISGDTLTWQDDMENAAEGNVFEKQ